MLSGGTAAYLLKRKQNADGPSSSSFVDPIRRQVRAQTKWRRTYSCSHLLFVCVCVLFHSGCTSGPTFERETVAVGQNVSLRCPRNSSGVYSLIWIRLVSGAFPKFLAQASTSDLPKSLNKESNWGDRITTRQEPGLFVLQIRPVQKSDMAVYYCLRGAPWSDKITFLNGIYLQVTGNYDNLQGVS